MSNIDILESSKTLDDLQYFWMPSGVPCFIANDDTICDIVEDLGFNIYYLLCNEKTITVVPASTINTSNNNWGSYPNYNNSPAFPPAAPTQKIAYAACLFKVINNFVGRVIEKSKDELPETFLSLQETCEYTMPAIPNSLIEKMDQFFRLVHSQHGTESIVLLTYDMEKSGPEGWGVLVPEQSNTAAHCKYDADSIAEIKPDHVMIVGSVHSHPEMSAYASGTDHDDQADFDGLHITYGWQKSSNNGLTQYHLELQMSGTAYLLKPEDVFEDYTLQKQPDAEVVEWSTKVKKAFPPHMGGTSVSATPITVTSQSPIITTSSKNGTTAMVAGALTNSNSFTITRNWQQMQDSLEKNALIIAEVSLLGFCPSCDYDISRFDINAYSCAICDTLIVLDSDVIGKVAQKFNQYCLGRYINPIEVIPYLYGMNDKDEVYLMKMNFHQDLTSPHNINDYIYEKDSDYLTLSKLDDDEDDAIYQTELTACCDTSLTDKNCECDPRLYPLDLLNFENAVADIDIYDASSVCSDCIHFYQTSCPDFKALLIEHTVNPNINLNEYIESIYSCNEYMSVYTQTYSTER